MRFLKSMRSVESRETDAFVDRLTLITNRGKGETASSGDSLAAEEAADSKRPQQRFWTPDELTAEAGGA